VQPKCRQVNFVRVVGEVSDFIMISMTDELKRVVATTASQYVIAITAVIDRSCRNVSWWSILWVSERYNQNELS